MRGLRTPCEQDDQEASEDGRRKQHRRLQRQAAGCTTRHGRISLLSKLPSRFEMVRVCDTFLHAAGSLRVD